MNSPSLLYYQHSGNYSGSAILVSLLGGAATALVLGFVYAYVILYCPFIYINFFATLFYGAAVGFVAAALLKRQHARNGGVAVAVGLALGLLAIWAQWVAWLFALLGQSDLERDLLVLALNPDALWSVILEVNKVGAWTLKGSTPTGGFLWGIWAVEALMIAGAALVVAKWSMDAEPYCESCGSWCKEEDNVAQVQTCDPEELKRRMESKDLGFLERLGARAEGASAWMQVGLHRCKQCGMTNTMKVDAITVTVDKKNKESKSTKTAFEKLLVTSGECDTVQQIARKLSAPGIAQAS